MPLGQKFPGWPKSPKKESTGVVARLSLDARGAVLANFATCWRSAERTSLAVKASGSASLQGCVATGGVWDQQAWLLVSGVLVQAILSREERRSDMQRLLHEAQGCRPCATCAATNRRRRPSHCCSGRHRRGNRGIGPTPLRCHPKNNRGIDSMGSDAMLHNGGECNQDCKMAKSTSLTTPFMK